MLVIDISVVDGKGKRRIEKIVVVRGAEHPKLRLAYYYEYHATIDGLTFTGTVVHSYDNGAVALTAKVTRAVVAQQRAARKQAR